MKDDFKFSYTELSLDVFSVFVHPIIWENFGNRRKVVECDRTLLKLFPEPKMHDSSINPLLPGYAAFAIISYLFTEYLPSSLLICGIEMMKTFLVKIRNQTKKKLLNFFSGVFFLLLLWKNLVFMPQSL